jgi:hypothetical protein
MRGSSRKESIATAPCEESVLDRAKNRNTDRGEEEVPAQTFQIRVPVEPKRLVQR